MEQFKAKRRPVEEPKGVSGTVFTLVHDLLYVLAAITVIFVLFARLTGVHGSSMYPTFIGQTDDGSRKGDYLVLESNVLNTDYKQGDIVVACLPSYDENRPIVKRVIATEGQTVDMHYNENDEFKVYVDGEEIDEPYIRDGVMHQTMYATLEFPQEVPEDCFFLMGDNRDNSFDSRGPAIGMVHRQYIVGKALFVIFPGQMETGAREWGRLFGLKPTEAKPGN